MSGINCAHWLYVYAIVSEHLYGKECCMPSKTFQAYTSVYESLIAQERNTVEENIK
jgi:hypothetical protein